MGSKEKIFVQFENVQEKYFIDDGQMKVEYILNSEFEPSTKDWLGVFPKGWRELEQQLVAEWAMPWQSDENKCKRWMDFNLSYLSCRVNCFNADYQFVYVNPYNQVIGRSSYFRLQRKSNDVHSQGDSPNVFENKGTGFVPELGSTSSGNHRPISPTDSLIKPVNCRGTAYPLVKPYRNESLMPVQYGRQYFTPCSFCLHKLHQNQLKDEQIKDLAEVNRILQKKLVDVEQRLELSLTAQKKLKLVCLCISQEKQSYQEFVANLMEWLQGNSPIRLRDSAKGSEMFVQRINGDIDNQIAQSKRQAHVGFMKAVIGNQENKIQELTTKLINMTERLAQYEFATNQPNGIINGEIEALQDNVHMNNGVVDLCTEDRNKMSEKNGDIDHCNQSGRDLVVVDKKNNTYKNFNLHTVTNFVQAVVKVEIEKKWEPVLCRVNNGENDNTDNDKIEKIG